MFFSNPSDPFSIKSELQNLVCCCITKLRQSIFCWTGMKSTNSFRVNRSDLQDQDGSFKVKLHRKIQSFSLIEVFIGGSMTLLCFCLFCYIVVSYVRRLHRSRSETTENTQHQRVYEEDDSLCPDLYDQESKHLLLPRP